MYPIRLFRIKGKIRLPAQGRPFYRGTARIRLAFQKGACDGFLKPRPELINLLGQK